MNQALICRCGRTINEEHINFRINKKKFPDVEPSEFVTHIIHDCCRLTVLTSDINPFLKKKLRLEDLI